MESEAAQEALKDSLQAQTEAEQLTWLHLPRAGVPGWLWTLNLETDPLPHTRWQRQNPHLNWEKVSQLEKNMAV